MGEYETVINWGGGLHHAKKAEASGIVFTFTLGSYKMQYVSPHSLIILEYHYSSKILFIPCNVTKLTELLEFLYCYRSPKLF